MSELDTSLQEQGKLGKTINTVTELAKVIPMYDDAIQPVAKEAGKALQTVGRAVNAALLPLKGLVWGFEQIEAFIQQKLDKKLLNVPVENIQTPDLSIAGPIIESLKYSGHKEDLSELYANLLASSIDIETAKNAHPGFVEIIRNISSDEARILKFLFINGSQPIIDIVKRNKDNAGEIIIREFICLIPEQAQCELTGLIGSYLVNLQRLGLILIDKTAGFTNDEVYKNIIEDPDVVAVCKNIDILADFESKIVKYYTRMTQYGYQFGEACIRSKN